MALERRLKGKAVVSAILLVIGVMKDGVLASVAPPPGEQRRSSFTILLVYLLRQNEARMGNSYNPQMVRVLLYTASY